jgi:deazaflavin-dependent oxidoreductase (nitroreductase family)
MESRMSAAAHRTQRPRTSPSPTSPPRFGGAFWRLSRRTKDLVLPLAGKTWNPVFAVVHHRGRRTGSWHSTPVAARRSGAGFVVALAFGAQVDWYRNLMAGRGGRLTWHGHEYTIGTPMTLDVATGLAAFHPIQRALLRFTGVDGYVRVADAPVAE